MSHDQLFKELFRTFFREFVELFLPDVAARLDFADVEFLEQETFTDFPEGDLRRADNIVRVRTRSGEPEIVLLHLEVETTRRTEFYARMYEYYSLIRRRTRQRVYPVVVYLAPGAGGIVSEQYVEELLEKRILTFEYTAIGLPDLPAGTYEQQDNLLGVALSSLMRPGQVSSVLRKWDLVRRVLTSELDESRKVVLANVVEKYLPLEGQDAQQYETLLRQNTPQEVQEMLSIYEIRGMERGHELGVQQGMQQGILQERKNALLRLLDARFTSVPDSIREAVSGATDAATLEEWFGRALTAASLADVGISSGAPA